MAMWAWILLYWPDGVVWFGVTKEVMMFCSVTSFLAAIWIQIATIHHMMLEKKGEIL
jgi:hypothetical protein